MKNLFKISTLLITISLVSFIFPHSEQNNEITRLKTKITRLENRIQYLESLISDNSNKKEVFTEKWKNKSNWRKLKRGMSFQEVREIFGEPRKIEGGYFTYWYYGSNKIKFSDGDLDKWTEPNF